MTTNPEPSTPAIDVVAIDGPSGAGKSTVARMLAQRLGFAYLDTGAMYRAVTWFFLENQWGDAGSAGAEEVARVEELLDQLDLDVRPDGHVILNGRDVSSHLRSREVESRVSVVSAMPLVRTRMRSLQQRIASRTPVVAEGRDMASVVFPGARWKFFLDAEPEERARRRHEEFVRRGREISEHDVLEEIAVRDRLDSTRKDAPLQRTIEALYVDTTGLTLEQVVDAMWQQIRPSSRTNGPSSADASGTAPADASPRDGAAHP
jgi:cytidylate kinase